MQNTLTLPAPEPSPLPSADNRRNGKVAKLPKAIRDRINHLLEDGHTYANIIEQLGPEGRDLTLDNLSQWKKGGYQDWLRDQFWRNEMRSRHEAFTDLLAGAEPIQLPEAGLQVAVTGICELLRDLGQNQADRKADSDKYVRVANSLARLSRSILQLQQYRDTTAKAKASELKNLDHNRDFTGPERESLLDRADNLFGFKSAARLKAEALAQADLSDVPSAESDPPNIPLATLAQTQNQPNQVESEPKIANPELSLATPANTVNGSLSENPQISNSQPDASEVPNSQSVASQISTPKPSAAAPVHTSNRSLSETSNPQISNTPSASEILNPQVLNHKFPPSACTLCTLRPDPWLPTALPDLCLDCAHYLNSQPP